MMFTADQLVAHAVGDYVIQSDWMATEKTKRSLAAGIHAISYLVPFLFLTQSPLALLAIGSTHFVIDRWRLARYFIWFKNQLFSPTFWGEHGSYSWQDCQKFGSPSKTPDWLAGWLHIFVDNILHICINAVAIRWL